ncbi:hypothetical protein [Streptomyces anulatus]
MRAHGDGKPSGVAHRGQDIATSIDGLPGLPLPLPPLPAALPE